MTELELLAAELKDALIALDRSRVNDILRRGSSHVGALQTLEGVIGPALDSMGADWEAGTLSLSQIYMAGKISEEATLALLPENSPIRKNDPLIALTVFEDRHMLGKRMVHASLRNDGYAVLDWGVTGLGDLIQKLRTEKVDLLFVSCLMLSSALRLGKLKDAMQAEGMRTRLVVGGAPFRFDPLLWKEVGADAMGARASDAPGLARALAGAMA